MRRPSPAILLSIGLHVGVAALALIGWGASRPTPAMPNSVPVSIVSDVVIEAAAPDNPSEELVEDDASTAPVEAPPPTPEPPTPTPPRPTPPPEKARAPRPTPTPTPPTKREPAPPRPNTPRTTPPRNEPTLDLDALSGPRRNTPNQGQRPATGQQGRGDAPRAQGPVSTAFFNEVYEHWNVFIVCDMQGGTDLRISMDVTLSADGRITAGPTLRNPQSGSVYQAAANEAMRALRESSPFDVPQGFEGGRFRPVFNVGRACANR